MAKKNNLEGTKIKINAFAKFSSIGIQMAVVIVGAVFLGDYLDTFLVSETPWMTILFSLLGVSAGLYLVIKEVMKLNK
ncbi:MAG: AtpZ/AtpI family protein [Flavobacteriales bacterium]